MEPPEQFKPILRTPELTRTRIILAVAAAVVADGLQLLLNGIGWAGPNQAIDVVAMLLMSWLLGFHWLLLPTFVLELAPIADDLPTWTACVITVIILRKRQQRAPSPSLQKKPPIEI